MLVRCREFSFKKCNPTADKLDDTAMYKCRVSRELLSQMSNNYYLCICFVCNISSMFDSSVFACRQSKLLTVSVDFLTIPQAADSPFTKVEAAKLLRNDESSSIAWAINMPTSVCFSSNSVVKGSLQSS